MGCQCPCNDVGTCSTVTQTSRQSSNLHHTWPLHCNSSVMLSGQTISAATRQHCPRNQTKNVKSIKHHSNPPDRAANRKLRPGHTYSQLAPYVSDQLRSHHRCYYQLNPYTSNQIRSDQIAHINNSHRAHCGYTRTLPSAPSKQQGPSSPLAVVNSNVRLLRLSTCSCYRMSTGCIATCA